MSVPRGSWPEGAEVLPPQAIPLADHTTLPLLLHCAADTETELSVADFRLSSIDLYLTSACNRKCTYCFLSDSFLSTWRNMPVTMVRDVLDWAAGSSIKEITLLGGEPALHPEFAAIVSLIGRSGLRSRTVTNGSHRFRKAIRDPAIDASIGRVAVSLDAPVAEVFDKLRGPRAYRDAMSTIEQLREQQKPFDINFTVVRSSLPYVGQMLKFAEDQGARRINMHWFSEVGRARTNPEDETVSPTDWRSSSARG